MDWAKMDLATVDRLLTTTRSVRKRLDFTRPVEPEIIERCIEIATQAPSGSNRQGWHFMVVTDPEKRMAIAEYYRKSFAVYIGSGSPRAESRRGESSASNGDDPRHARAARVRDSAIYLAEHFHEAPVHIIPCIEGRPTNPAPSAQAGLYGSILPAAWSLMLALRARGIGAAWTTLHLPYEQEVAKLLGIPSNITQAALLPVAYFKGDDFQPASRVPARTLTYWDSWGATR
jgi:nitroreductase